jgi:hypothetical protein
MVGSSDEAGSWFSAAGPAVQLAAENCHGARLRRHESEGALGQGGLAGTGFADQADEFARPDVQ